VYADTMITDAVTSRPSSVRRRALNARWGRLVVGDRLGSTGTRASLSVPGRIPVEPKAAPGGYHGRRWVTNVMAQP